MTYVRTIIQISRLNIPESVSLASLAHQLPAPATSLLCYKIIEIFGSQNPKIIAVSPCKANIMYSMSKYVSIETSFGPLLEQIKYPCLKQLYIVDVMKILPVFINILEQV